MRAILVQQGLWAFKIEKVSKDGKEDDKDCVKKMDLTERAHSAIILSLSDRVLREVCKEKTTAAVWVKLESIYLTKSLANRLYMKQKLYSLKFSDGQGILEQLEEFGKAVDDLRTLMLKFKMTTRQ